MVLRLVHSADRAPARARASSAKRRKGSDSSAPDPWRRLGRLLCALVAVAAVYLWGLYITRERRGLAEVPGGARREAYRNELASFHALCANPSAALEHRCAAKARFLLAFPECTGDCEELALRMAPRATR